MKRVGIGITLLSAFLYMGCGGGGTSSKLIIKTDADALAYKANEAEWKTDVGTGKDIGNGLKEYTIDKASKMNVALYCKNQKEYYLAGITGDDGNIYVKCSTSSSGTSLAKGNLNSTASGGAPTLYYVAVGTIFNGANPYTLHPPKGIYDRIVSSINVATPLRFMIARNVDYHADRIDNLTVTDTNSCPIKNANFSVQAGTTGRIVLISKGETYFTSTLGNKWYYPDGCVNGDDTFVTVGTHAINKAFFLQTFPATDTKSDVHLDIGYINPLIQIHYSNSGTVTGMDQYSKASKSPSLAGYMLGAENGGSSYYLMLSKKYLGDSGTFELDMMPDLSGFEGSWRGTNAASVSALVVMSASNFGDMMESGRTLKLAGIPFSFMLQKGTVEIASQAVK